MNNTPFPDARALLMRTDSIRKILDAFPGINVFGNERDEWSGAILLNENTVRVSTTFKLYDDGEMRTIRYVAKISVEMEVEFP